MLPVHATRPWAEGGHCYWAVFRSPLPPDSLAVHFQRAYSALGLTNATWTRQADTVWAHAGPTPLNGDLASAVAESRVVGYLRNDSTYFRHYVAVLPPPGGWPHDTVNVTARQIEFCGEIGKAAAVNGWAPRNPDGEETLKVWTRMP